MSDRRTRRRWPWITGVAVVVVLLGVGAALWWFVLRDDAPAPVDIDEAVDQLDDGEGGSEPVDDVEGTWTVDTSLGGEGDDGVFAGFRIAEELGRGIGSNTATGRTPDLSGTVTIEGTTVSAVDIEVDLTTITSERSQRDPRIQRALETGDFPTATFALAEPIELDTLPGEGEQISVTASGELTLHGETRTVDVEIDAERVGAVLAVVGRTEIVLSDFDIEAPSAPIVVSVADDAVVEWQLFLTRA